MSDAIGSGKESDEESRLERLYRAVGRPANPSQTAFVRAWEMCGFIAGDGFEWLFDQDRSPEELVAVFESVGFLVRRGHHPECATDERALRTRMTSIPPGTLR